MWGVMHKGYDEQHMRSRNTYGHVYWCVCVYAGVCVYWCVCVCTCVLVYMYTDVHDFISTTIHIHVAQVPAKMHPCLFYLVVLQCWVVMGDLGMHPHHLHLHLPTTLTLLH